MAALIPFNCASDVAPATIAAVVRVESSANPLAIHDNATGKTYAPDSVGAAQKLLDSLLAEKHSVDVGLMQVNSKNFSKYGVKNPFDACENVRAGGQILADAYKTSAGAGFEGRQALHQAFQIYNAGRLGAAPGYADAVFGGRVRSASAGVGEYAASSTAWGVAQSWKP